MYVFLFLFRDVLSYPQPVSLLQGEGEAAPKELNMHSRRLHLRNNDINPYSTPSGLNNNSFIFFSGCYPELCIFNPFRVGKAEKFCSIIDFVESSISELSEGSKKRNRCLVSQNYSIASGNDIYFYANTFLYSFVNGSVSLTFFSFKIKFNNTPTTLHNPIPDI